MNGRSSKCHRPSAGGEQPAERQLGASIGAIAGDVDPAVIPAQKLEAFTVALPFQVQVMLNVAVRSEAE
jgi:hypothetical protein